MKKILRFAGESNVQKQTVKYKEHLSRKVLTKLTYQKQLSRQKKGHKTLSDMNNVTQT